jgi:hypothetical protein
MSMQCPILLPTVVMADDARLAAQISCVLAQPQAYLPIFDGPRMTRLDRDAEVIRRNNAAARVKPRIILCAGMADESYEAVSRLFAPGLCTKLRRMAGTDDLGALRRDGAALRDPPLVWGRDRIAVGLLKALYARTSIVFTEDRSPIEHVPSKSGHLVVCEQGEALAEVIAANYAFALGAGLCVVPELLATELELILNRFYDSPRTEGASTTQVLSELKDRLRKLAGSLPIDPGGSITFITSGAPYGFAYPEIPSTHLFNAPDLGLAVVNGFAAEQRHTRGIGVAVLVDPQTTDAPEIAAAERLLPPRGMLVRTYPGAAATVRAVTEMIELFPFDFLMIATHCGDSSGYRWTYEFVDSEGHERRFVVDIAIGVARTDDDDLLKVTQYIRPVSIDGVAWDDPRKREKVNVGTAFLDLMERMRSDAPVPLEPVKKETVNRVVWSAALKMFDQNYIALPRSVAGEGTPIVINNACASWHQLAGTFTFGGTRAYIGTLFDVTTSEAHDVVVKLLDKRYGKPLPGALWSTQREVYGNSVRRPYIMTGIYPQRLRVSRHDVPQYIDRRLTRALAKCREQMAQAGPANQRWLQTIKEEINYYERELVALRRRWPMELKHRDDNT